jgi:two-component system response regulator MtrA
MTSPSDDRVRTVLLVDDESLITDILSARLREAGFDVMVTGNGLEALDALAKRQADLVITDLRMPFMGGIELIATLASDPRTSSIPVLLLTAGAGSVDATIAPNVMATVRKPFAADEIVTRSIGLLRQNAETSAACDLRPADLGDD